MLFGLNFVLWVRYVTLWTPAFCTIFSIYFLSLRLVLSGVRHTELEYLPSLLIFSMSSLGLFFAGIRAGPLYPVVEPSPCFRFGSILLSVSLSVLNLRLVMWNDLLMFEGVLRGRSKFSLFSIAEGVLRPSRIPKSESGGTEDEVPGLEWEAEPKIELRPLNVSSTLEYC